MRMSDIVERLGGGCLTTGAAGGSGAADFSSAIINVLSICMREFSSMGCETTLRSGPARDPHNTRQKNEPTDL